MQFLSIVEETTWKPKGPVAVIEKLKKMLELTQNKLRNSKMIYFSLLSRQDHLQSEVTGIDDELQRYCQANISNLFPRITYLIHGSSLIINTSIEEDFA